MLVVASGGACLAAIVTGFALALMRSAETGYTFVSIPRFAYFLWVLFCVMLILAMRQLWLGVGGLCFAAAVGWYALVGDEPQSSTRRRELEERLAGCRRALVEDERNPASLELIGDVYSTLEDRELALRYWERSYAVVGQAKLLDKIDNLKRAKPVFYAWGAPCLDELRACPGCERLCGRLDFACPCGRVFYPGTGTWLAARFNRLCENTGAGAALETGLLFLPFLYLNGPLPYALAWLAWTAARRPGPREAR